MTNLYARAYARGLNADLVAAGTVVYPSKIAMDIAADAVADHVLAGQNFLRIPSVPTKVASDAVAGLVAISEDLCNQAGGYAPELSKVASAANGLEVARYEALQLLKEAEAEARNPTVTEPASTGTDTNPTTTNSAPNASATGEAVEAPAKQDGADGVPGQAVEGVEHAIGGHGTTPASEKLASFARRLTAKIAATGSNPTSVESSPKTEQSATGEPSKIVAKANPAEGGIPASAEQGTEMAQKVASYLGRVEKVASAAIPYLPGDLPEYAQIAHVRALSKLASAGDQGKYVYLMYSAYGMPEDDALKYASEYMKRASDMGAAEDEGEDEKEEKDDGSSDKAVSDALEAAAAEIEEGQASEKKEEEAKLASVDRLRRTVQG